MQDEAIRGAAVPRRRAFAQLAGAAALVGTLRPTAPLASPAIGGPDAALIALCAELVAMTREQLRVSAAYSYREDIEAASYRAMGDRELALIAQCRQLAGRIGRMPVAQTLEGVRARGAAVRAMMMEDDHGASLIEVNWHVGVLDALMRDLGVARVLHETPAVAL